MQRKGDLGDGVRSHTEEGRLGGWSEVAYRGRGTGVNEWSKGGEGDGENGSIRERLGVRWKLFAVLV